MFAHNSETRSWNNPPKQDGFRGPTLLMLVLLMAMPVGAQGTFNSGSTGADGEFKPTQNTTLQIPESGVFNYTAINIPANVTITFKKNSRNTPVTMLASGDVIIAGVISVAGQGRNGRLGGEGGPGGFRGGDGGHFLLDRNGKNGEGPGGGKGGAPNQPTTSAGHATPGSGVAQGLGGRTYGSKTLIPLVGGSGGGGELASEFDNGRGGNGGGGAILIASSGKITITGAIYADAGTFDQGSFGGSGGAIRLVANLVSGKPTLSVSGGPGFFFGPRGGSGYIRVEAFNLLDFDQTSSSPTITTGKPNPATLPNLPQLRIVSVGGERVPDNPVGSFHRDPDVTLPATISNPITVQIAAQNIPVGTVLKVVLVPETGNRVEVNSTPLAEAGGNFAASAQVTLPTSGISVITVATTLDIRLAMNAPMFIDGERVQKMEVAAAFGGQSEVTYITESGRRLKWPQ